jgi:3,4-dihydroxy 2-butanone 4-phosphate synthase/GTP cyclohydrolase II
MAMAVHQLVEDDAQITSAEASRSEPARATSVNRCLDALRAGQAVLVVDDIGEHTRCELVVAASVATPERIAFMTRYGTGFISVSLPAARADALELPSIGGTTDDTWRVAFGVTVDARHGVSTGISATDRARTIRKLAWRSSSPVDFTRPGHIATIRTSNLGVLARPAFSEAVVELSCIAGLPAAAAHVALVSEQDATQLADVGEAETFAASHGLCTVRASEVVTHAAQRFQHLINLGALNLSVRKTDFSAIAFRSAQDAREHLVLSLGPVRSGEVIDVHVHRECAVSDVFGALGCDCRSRLDASISAVAAGGTGVVIYLGDRVKDGNLLERLSAVENGSDESGAGLRVVADPRDTIVSTQVLANIGVRRANVYLYEHGVKPRVTRLDLPDVPPRT